MDITGVPFSFSLRKGQRFSAPSSGAGTWEGLRNACWMDVETWAALKSESRTPRILHLGSFRELGLSQDTLPCSFPSPLGSCHQQINMCRHVHLVVAAVQSLSYVQLFETLRTTAHQASLSFTISWSFSNSCSLGQ